ncbi:MAG: type II secretion system protein [Synergistaceae bacterium]|nr:type II secretion system protein [Synergistaceae bacterium]
MTTNRAFTLVEILVAVMLTGILTTLALAPVVITVRRVVDTQTEYTDFAALSRTMNFIARDLNSAMRMAPNVITINDHEALGGHDDDALLIMSTAPTAQNLPSGTLVYKVSEGGMLHGNVIPGLYRWIFPGKVPNVIKIDTLNPEDGQLVLPGVSGFSVEIPTGAHEDDRRISYSGALPSAIYIKLVRGERTAYTAPIFDDEHDKRNELESIIVFP